MRALTITRDMQLALNAYTQAVIRSRRAYAEDAKDARPVKTGRNAPCACCGEIGPIYSRRLIAMCYRRHSRAGTLEDFPRRDNQ